MKFATKAIHSGQEPDEATGAVMPPMYLTSTFALEAPGVTKGYDYTRSGNPNFTKLEGALAALEGASYATVFSSGIGALTGLLSTLKQGDKIVAVEGLYGGTYRLFTSVFQKFGIQFSIINIQEKEKFQKALADNPEWLFFETPTNPLLEIMDIQALATLAKKHAVRTIVDNTFASPYFQSPLALGADAVLHSTTKYIGGHSDLIGGTIITNDLNLKQALDFARKAVGLNPSPFDAWLALRGVKTLALRMEQHQKNALAIAAFLKGHPLVRHLYYPGIETHRGYEIAKRQMRGFSGIVSVDFNLSLEQTKQLAKAFKLFTLAESLGGVESLVNFPALMTHSGVPAADRQKQGITDSLLRFSVGIEDPEDLIADLEQALNT